jgi:hypothetical protein
MEKLGVGISLFISKITKDFARFVSIRQTNFYQYYLFLHNKFTAERFDNLCGAETRDCCLRKIEPRKAAWKNSATAADMISKFTRYKISNIMLNT